MKFAANLNLKGHQFLLTHPVEHTNDLAKQEKTISSLDCSTVYRPISVDLKMSSCMRSGGQLETNCSTECELMSSRFFHYMQSFATGQQVQWVYKSY